jgi:hypothetical protein
MVPDLFVKREADVSTDCVRASLAAGGVVGTAIVRGRAKLFSVTIATNRDGEKHGLNRMSSKSAANRANRTQNDKLCHLQRMSGRSILSTARRPDRRSDGSEFYDNFVKVIK